MWHRECSSNTAVEQMLCRPFGEQQERKVINKHMKLDLNKPMTAFDGVASAKFIRCLNRTSYPLLFVLTAKDGYQCTVTVDENGEDLEGYVKITNVPTEYTEGEELCC